MNARQKRLFEEARKKNPNLKIPSEPQPSSELTEDDLALIKQGVGDKTPRTSLPQSAPGSGDQAQIEQRGSIVKYFEDKGFGFIRPDDGGRDIFFHVSRLIEGAPTDLIPHARVLYELGMDRSGKIAASSLRISPPEPAG